jgi:hypothetical protein
MPPWGRYRGLGLDQHPLKLISVEYYLSLSTHFSQPHKNKIRLYAPVEDFT